MCSVHEQCTVTSPVRVGSGTRGRSRPSTPSTGTLARREPATTPSSPFSRPAPVTEIPTVSEEHPRLCPPNEQSLCQLTSDMPSTTPIFLSRPSAESPTSGSRCTKSSSVNDGIDRKRSLRDQLAQRRRLLVEAEDPRRVPLAFTRARPPRRTVVTLGGGDRGVELGRHRRHLRLGEHALEVQVARLGEEVPDLRRVVVEREGPVEIEGRAGPVDERDRARLVDRAAVEQAPQHRLPLEEAVEAAAHDLGASGHLQPERRRDVLHQVGERGTVERHHERVVGTALAPRVARPRRGTSAARRRR